jgi:hypothetical protein
MSIIGLITSVTTHNVYAYFDENLKILIIRELEPRNVFSEDCINRFRLNHTRIHHIYNFS